MKPKYKKIPDHDCLILKKSGTLVSKYWEYDDEKEEGEFRFEVIDTWNGQLFNDKPCYFETGLILHDLFLFLDQNLEIWDLFCGNWLKEIVNEGLNNEFKPNNEYGTVDYLELYWLVEKTTYKNKKTDCSGFDRLNFHGIGTTLEGDKTSWAIEFSPTWELTGLPLVVNPKVNLYVDDHNKEKSVYRKKNLGEHMPSLYQIVYGVAWELSFCGSPDDRDNKKSKLNKIAKEVEGDLKNGRYEKFEILEND